MHKTNVIGKYGEDLAVKYLLKNNYIIIDRNYRCNFGEIDIIAHNKKELVFIEVKTRTSNKFGTGVEAINKAKQKHIYKTAQYYLYGNRENNVKIRIDAIEINIFNTGVFINHYLNIIKDNLGSN